MLTEEITTLSSGLPKEEWKFHFIKGRFVYGENLISFYQTLNRSGDFKLHFIFLDYESYAEISNQVVSISESDLLEENKTMLLGKIKHELEIVLSGDCSTKLNCSKSILLSEIINENILPEQFKDKMVEI